MGSGSSRSGRALRRLRSPDSRPAGPDGAVPEGGTGPRVSAPAAAAAGEEAPEAAAGTDPSPAAPPDGGDETLRLLDQLLAESAGWGPGELAPRGSARPRPAAGAGRPRHGEFSKESLRNTDFPWQISSIQQPPRPLRCPQSGALKTTQRAAVSLKPQAAATRSPRGSRPSHMTTPRRS
ncbi:cystin-1 isoform X1 [Budorcas taxicolor]|uniref:cystin-1 isoform X1 n=1 Tax=Budorcas taxicolor TaxID=37181 RepID=UPI0022833C27|nr:cystin-1 isoform X1 [Budorcas taxicolor]